MCIAKPLCSPTSTSCPKCPSIIWSTRGSWHARPVCSVRTGVRRATRAHRLRPQHPMLQAAAIIWLPLVLAACSDHDASEPEPEVRLSLEGRNVIRYSAPARILETFLIQGRRDAAGRCGFAYSTTLKRGDMVFESITEYDPESCKYVIARHPSPLISNSQDLRGFSQQNSANAQETSTLEIDYGGSGAPVFESSTGHGQATTSGVPGRAPSPPSKGTSQATSSASPQIPPGCSPYVGYDRTAWQKLWHNDPIGITVAGSHLDVFSFYDETCIQYARSTHTTEWNDNLGWYRVNTQH